MACQPGTPETASHHHNTPKEISGTLTRCEPENFVRGWEPSMLVPPSKGVEEERAASQS